MKAVPGGNRRPLPADGARRRDDVRRPAKLAEMLAREIVADIAGSRMEPGDMLPSEAVMLERLQVGRSSLREALRILEVQGILTMKPGPGGGPVVAQPGSAAFARILALHSEVRHVRYRELVETRLALEPVAARLAAERTDAETAALLREHLAQEAAMLDGEDAAIIRSWAQFHYLVGGLSGNGMLDLFTRATGELYRDRVVTREEQAGRTAPMSARRHTNDAHAKIAAAIIAGRATRAERLMREHMAELSANVAGRLPELMDDVITWADTELVTE